MDQVTQHNNVFFQEKNATYAYIYNFNELSRFWITTPTFSFDSHGDSNKGWLLLVKQRHFNRKPKKLVVNLTHLHTNSKIVIRPSKEYRERLITSFEDATSIFSDGSFVLEHAVTMHQKRPVPKVRPVESYTDDELLQIIHARTMERVGDYRGPKPAPIDMTNVIDLDQIRQVKFDDSLIEKVLAA